MADTPTPEKKPAPVITDDQAKIDSAGRLLHALAQNPEFRPEVLKLIKKASPETPIPELDLIDRFRTELEANVKAGDEKQKPLLDKLDKIERHLARESFKEKNKLDEAELVEVETLAKEGAIGNSETALKFWQMQGQLGKPRGTAIPDDAAKQYQDKLKKINPRNTKQLEHAAVDEATRIMNDFAKRR